MFTEQWVARLFEPVRTSFFDGPQPPPMQFLMPDSELPADAEVSNFRNLWLLVEAAEFSCVIVFECCFYVWNVG